MIVEEISIGFIAERGYKARLEKSVLKVDVGNAVIHIFPDGDDPEQVGIQVFVGNEEFYWAWVGWGYLEETFDEILDELGE